MQDSDNKRFALYDEGAGVVTDELSNSSDIQDLFGDLEGAAVELLDESKEFAKKEEDIEDLSDLDLSPGAIDKSNDSVRVYLREMGMVPLLTREGEIELAKRIEHGERAVRKALSRSQLIVQILLETKAQLEEGRIPVLDVVQSPEAHIGSEDEDTTQPLKEQLLASLSEVEKLHRKEYQMRQKLLSMSRNMKPKQYRRSRYECSRFVVSISQQIRSIPFSSRFQRSLSSALKQALDRLRPLEQEVVCLERRLESVSATETAGSNVFR